MNAKEQFETFWKDAVKEYVFNSPEKAALYKDMCRHAFLAGFEAGQIEGPAKCFNDGKVP